jgi:hypothetical protein
VLAKSNQKSMCFVMSCPSMSLPVIVPPANPNGNITRRTALRTYAIAGHGFAPYNPANVPAL